MEEPTKRRRVSRPPPDPRYHQVLLDAHILDDTGDAEVAGAVETIMGQKNRRVGSSAPFGKGGN